MMLIEDIGRCMIDQGINKIILIAGHTSREQKAVLVLSGQNLMEKYGVMYTVYEWMEEISLLGTNHPEVVKLREMTKVGDFFGRVDGERFGTDYMVVHLKQVPCLQSYQNWSIMNS